VNKKCPHCRHLVVLPTFVQDYPDLPVKCHACAACFFPFAGTAATAGGGVTKQRCNSCSTPIYLPKTDPDHPRASYICPHCNSDLSPKAPRRWSAYGAVALAILVGIVGGALFGGFQPSDLHNPDMFISQMRAATQLGWNGFTDWLHQLAAELR